jgi:formylmethanofuran dehydrogenase subunit A
MDRSYREEILKTVHPAVRERSQLADITRTYSLNEIAIITRAGPARILGLAHKGHLGPGADADITIYTPHENKETMFSLPRYVIKSGRILVEEGDIRVEHFGKTLYVAPGYDLAAEKHIADWFERFYSVQFQNYPVGREYFHDSEQIPCT